MKMRRGIDAIALCCYAGILFCIFALGYIGWYGSQTTYYNVTITHVSPYTDVFCGVGSCSNVVLYYVWGITSQGQVIKWSVTCSLYSVGQNLTISYTNSEGWEELPC